MKELLALIRPRLWLALWLLAAQAQAQAGLPPTKTYAVAFVPAPEIVYQWKLTLLEYLPTTGTTFERANATVISPGQPRIALTSPSRNELPDIWVLTGIGDLVWIPAGETSGTKVREQITAISEVAPNELIGLDSNGRLWLFVASQGQATSHELSFSDSGLDRVGTPVGIQRIGESQLAIFSRTRVLLIDYWALRTVKEIDLTLHPGWRSSMQATQLLAAQEEMFVVAAAFTPKVQSALLRYNLRTGVVETVDPKLALNTTLLDLDPTSGSVFALVGQNYQRLHRSGGAYRWTIETNLSLLLREGSVVWIDHPRSGLAWLPRAHESLAQKCQSAFTR